MDSLQSHYRINVADKTGSYRTGGGQTVDTAKHFFAVDVIGKKNAQRVHKSLCEKYPKAEYCIDVTYWGIGGSAVEFD